MDQYKATEQAYKNGYAKGYADGVKEFSEKLNKKAHIHNCRYGGFPYDITAVETKEIDNLAAEMVGADNG